MLYILFDRIFYLFERFTNSSGRIFYSSELIFYLFEQFTNSSERRIFFYLASLRRRTTPT